MARIAVIVSNPCVADARVIKMARAAAETGHEVHVFATLNDATLPYDNSTEIIYHRLEWRPGQRIIENTPLRFVAKLNRAVASYLATVLVPFLKYRMFSLTMAEHIAAIKPDIIHAHDLICLPAGYDAAELSGAKLVYDAHELEVHRNPPLPFLQKRFVSYMEYKYGSKAFAVNTVGRLVGEVLKEHLGREDINILYNSPIISPCECHIRTDLGIGESTPLLIYVGKVAAGRGVSEILPLLPKLKGTIFATVGPCDDKQRQIILKQAKKVGVSDRVRILPPVPFEQVVDYIRGADVGIISVEPVTLSYQYCMPNKLFEMSFANVPIVSNKLDEIEQFLAENGNGEIVDFENKNSLAYAIFKMINEKQRYVMDAERLEALAASYSWQAQKAKLLKIYEKALANEVSC